MGAVAYQNATPAHNLSISARAEAQGKTISPTDSLLSIPRGDVTASLNFYKPPKDGSVPFNYVETPPAGKPKSNYGEFMTSVTIRDIRGHKDEYGLDNNVSAVVRNVPDSAEKDFTSGESIKQNYYPKVEKVLLENVPGSHRVFIYDHTIRRPVKGGAG